MHHLNLLELFIQRYGIASQQPWIVAISAGVDSAVLLDAFVALLQKRCQSSPKKVVIAHFDHGWRPESSEEARFLHNKINAYAQVHTQLVFESAVGCSCPEGENLEAWARQQRYQFLQGLAKRYHSSWIFLAHHGDDRRETTLKNLLEGKELAFLHGMRPLTPLDFLKPLQGLATRDSKSHDSINQESIHFEAEGLAPLDHTAVNLCRPWLSLEKSRLREIAAEQELEFFEDSTNSDERFLRARIRGKIDPMLDSCWPKAWRKGLQQIAKYSEELYEDLFEEIQPHQISPQRALGGWQWLLPPLIGGETSSGVGTGCYTWPRHLWRFFLRLASSYLEPLGREGSTRLLEGIELGKNHLKYRGKSYLWQLEFPYLLALELTALEDLSSLDDPVWNQPLNLCQGSVCQWGPWRVESLAQPPSQEQLHRSLRESVIQGLLYTCQSPIPPSMQAPLSEAWIHLGLIREAAVRSRVLRHLQRSQIPDYARKWLPLRAQAPRELRFQPKRAEAAESSHWICWTWQGFS